MENQIVVDKALLKVVLNTMFMAGTNFGLLEKDSFDSVWALAARRDAKSLEHQREIFKLLHVGFEEEGCGNECNAVPYKVPNFIAPNPKT